MSGVEEVLNDPPDKIETEVEQIEIKENVPSEAKASSDSETTSLTGSWTLLEKDEADAAKVGLFKEIKKYYFILFCRKLNQKLVL